MVLILDQDINMSLFCQNPGQESGYFGETLISFSNQDAKDLFSVISLAVEELRKRNFSLELS